MDLIYIILKYKIEIKYLKFNFAKEFEGELEIFKQANKEIESYAK